MGKKIKLLKELGLDKLGQTYQNYKKKRKEEVSKRIRKEKKDFQIASVNIEDSEIRSQMEKALLRAKEDFK